MQRLMHRALFHYRRRQLPPPYAYLLLPPQPRSLPQLLLRSTQHPRLLCRKWYRQLRAGLAAARQLHALDPRPAGLLQEMTAVNVTPNKESENPPNVDSGRGAFLRLHEGTCVTIMLFVHPAKRMVWKGEVQGPAGRLPVGSAILHCVQHRNT